MVGEIVCRVLVILGGVSFDEFENEFSEWGIYISFGGRGL